MVPPEVFQQAVHPSLSPLHRRLVRSSVDDPDAAVRPLCKHAQSPPGFLRTRGEVGREKQALHLHARMMMWRIPRKTSVHSQHRACRLPDNGLRRTAETQPIPSGATFRSHHDHLGMKLPHGLQDAGIGNSESQRRVRRNPRFPGHPGQAAQLEQRGGLEGIQVRTVRRGRSGIADRLYHVKNLQTGPGHPRQLDRIRECPPRGHLKVRRHQNGMSRFLPGWLHNSSSHETHAVLTQTTVRGPHPPCGYAFPHAFPRGITSAVIAAGTA